MEHPTHEKLLSHLDGADDKALREHLEKCPQCASELEGWRRSVQRLQSSRLPEPETLSVFPGIMLKWAAAAAVIILAVGFGLGRFSGPNIPRMKQTIAAEVRQEVKEELKRQMVASFQAAEQRQEQDQKALLSALSRLQRAHEADYVSLRHDLETVAMVADRNLRHDQQQLNQITATILANNN